MKSLLAACKNPLWWLALVIAWLVVLAVFAGASQYQHQQAVQQYQQFHQQQSQQQAQSVAALLADWQQQFDTVVGALQQIPGNTVVDRSDAWPQAQALCVIPGIPEQPLENPCWPLSYASLVSLRQALEDRQPAAFLLNTQSDNPVVLLSRVIRESGRPMRGVIAVLDVGPIYQMLAEALPDNAGVAIAQGLDEPAAVVWQHGLEASVDNVFSADVAGTAWQLRYQPAALPPQPRISLWVIPVLLMVIFFLVWLFEQLASRQRLTRSAHPLTTFHTRLEITEPQPVSEDTTSAFPRQTPSRNLAEKLDPAIFKQDAILGVVGSQLNEAIMHRLGQAIGSEAAERQQFALVVGRDGRLSSASFARALIRGLNESGCEVIDIGEVPTPLMYFGCHHLGTGSGVMVAGSHNPVDYNGLTIVMDGEILADGAIEALYRRIVKTDFISGEAGHIDQDVTADYVAAVGRDITLARPLKVVVDCANGIVGKVVPTLLRTLDCEVVPLFCEVDACLPRQSSDHEGVSSHTELITTVKQQQADLGLAFDSDGRCLTVVDAGGQIIRPDQLFRLFVDDVLDRKPASGIVFDVASSRLLAEYIVKAGGVPLMSAYGCARLQSMLKKHRANLAGGIHGEILFTDRWYGFEDALYAACRLLKLCSADSERSPSELLNAFSLWPATAEIPVLMPAVAARDFMQQFLAQARFDDAHLTTIDGLRIDFDEGWGLIRQSDNGPGLLLRFEARTEADLFTVRTRINAQMLSIDPTLDLDW